MTRIVSVNALAAPSAGRIFAQQVIATFPESFYRIFEYLPSHSLKPLKDVKKEAGKVGKELIERGTAESEKKKGMSVVLELLCRYLFASLARRQRY